MSRIAWVPDFGDGPELYQRVEVPEPGDPGWPGADLPKGDPWAVAVNQIRAEIAADYAEAQAEAEAEWAHEWDSEDSSAYQARVEAEALKPEPALTARTPMFPGGLYGSGMHEYVLDEIELGPRAAAYADAEACGDSPLSPDPEPEAEL